MTAIIVILVFALLFFVAAGVIALLIWKRETEIRTDSLKEFERNFGKILTEISDTYQYQSRMKKINQNKGDWNEEKTHIADPGIVTTLQNRKAKSKNAEAFEWVKIQEADEKKRKSENRKIILSDPEIIVPAKSDAPVIREVPAEQAEPAEPETPVIEKVQAEQEQPAIETVQAEPDMTAEPEAEEIILPEVEDKDEKTELSDYASLEESFREVESLIRTLKDDTSDYEINLETTAEDDPGLNYMNVDEEPALKHVGYDTGRSGRKYTAEELEALIKE